MPRNPAPHRPAKAEPFTEPEQVGVAVLDKPEPIAEQPEPMPIAKPHPAAVDVVNRRSAELAAAEHLLQSVVDGHDLTADEDELLRHLYPGEFDRSHELQRIARYRRLQGLSGGSVERGMAVKNASTAATKLAVEGDVIREKMATLQGELTALEKAATDATRESETRSAAVSALADATLLPEPLRSRYRFERDRWEKSYGIPARTTRQEGQGLVAAAGLDPAEDAARILQYCSTHKELGHVVTVTIREGSSHPVAVFQRRSADDGPRPFVVKDQRHITVDAASWREYAAELRDAGEEKLQLAEQLDRDGEPLKQELAVMLESLVPE